VLSTSLGAAESGGLDDGLQDGLQPIAGVSGAAPLFDEALLGAARAMARRYVHPLSAFLRIMTPPRMGRPMGRKAAGLPAPGPVPAGAPAEGGRTLRRLGPREDPAAIYAEAIAAELAEGRGAIVAVPEVGESTEVLERLQRSFPDTAAVVHSGAGPAERSRALWSVATGERRLVLGGRAGVFAPAFPLGLVIVHAESDRSLKEQRSPYYDAREVAEARAASCGAALLLTAEAPSLRTLVRAEAWKVQEPTRESIRSAWPIVELVEPSRSAMPQRAVAAILAAVRSGTRVFVLVPRLKATPSGPGPAEVAAYLRRAAPQIRVARADPGAIGGAADLAGALGAEIVVATEGVLDKVKRPAIGTAIALGVDAMIHRPTGRAAEEAFGTLWELVSLLARSGRSRLLLETATPGHHAVQAVVRGDYHFFAQHELEARRAALVPPFSALIRIRAVRQGVGDEVLERLAALPGTELLGPVEGALGAEILLKVDDRELVLDPLRSIVASAGERLLVEMDPREW
jgi:primosomal protein N' (replication factor Y)